MAGSKTVYTRAVAFVKRPDVRLNVNAVTVAEPLYRGTAHRRRGIRLINNTDCDLVYSWGNPTGSDADRMECAVAPSAGTVGGNSTVEFEFTVTPTATCVSVVRYFFLFRSPEPVRKISLERITKYARRLSLVTPVVCAARGLTEDFFLSKNDERTFHGISYLVDGFLSITQGENG